MNIFDEIDEITNLSQVMNDTLEYSLKMNKDGVHVQCIAKIIL